LIWSTNLFLTGVGGTVCSRTPAPTAHGYWPSGADCLVCWIFWFICLFLFSGELSN